MTLIDKCNLKSCDEWDVSDLITAQDIEIKEWREFLKMMSRAQPVLQSLFPVSNIKQIYPPIKPSNILSYDYIKDEQNNIAKTIIHWTGGVTTTCSTTLGKADQYTGFMIAVAKYAMGNKNVATNTADYWINKRPAQLAKAREKAKAEEAEIKRITDKRRKRREQHRLYLAAIRRKEAYEAAKLANEKYGVPLNFKEDGEDK